MNKICPHCGSTNLGPEYTETLDLLGTDDPLYKKLETITVRDCLNCGELAAVEERTIGPERQNRA